MDHLSEVICEKCGLSYETGNHQVRDDGRFPPSGHYFEEQETPDEPTSE